MIWKFRKDVHEEETWDQKYESKVLRQREKAAINMYNSPKIKGMFSIGLRGFVGVCSFFLIGILGLSILRVPIFNAICYQHHLSFSYTLIYGLFIQKCFCFHTNYNKWLFHSFCVHFNILHNLSLFLLQNLIFSSSYMCDIYFIQLNLLLWLKLFSYSLFSTFTTINTVSVSYCCVTN